MIKHTFLLIYRNFKRFRTTFFINLIGLSTGMACVLLIYLWIEDEWSVDRYHQKDARLFQVMEHKKTEKGIETKGHTQDFLAQVLEAEMPEIETAVTTTPPSFFPEFTINANGKHVDAVGKYASKSFFEMFSYGLLYGDEAQALADENSMVISEGLAKRLFPDVSDIVGRSAEYDLQTLKKQVTITGVFKNLPKNSSEHFDFILSFDAFRDIMGMKNRTLNWDSAPPFFTYVTLHEGTDVDKFNTKLGGFLPGKSTLAKNRTLFVKPFSDNYLYGKYEDGIIVGGRIEYVKMFSIVAVIILLIACVNFMNLSTAKASRRIKEIGIKKAIGASRKTLIIQYIGESMLISILSLALAILFVDIFLPSFNVFTRKNLSLNAGLGLISAIATVAVATGLIAGLYPAFYLSGFNTAKVLRGRLETLAGEFRARRGLVVFQFSISVILIVAVFVAYKQMQYVQTKNLGYNSDNVIYFETNGKVAERPQTFLSELKKIPGVVNASSMLGSLIGGSGNSLGGGTPGVHSWQGKEVVMQVFQVNYDLIETLGIEVVAGRSFSRAFGSDTLQFIYNQKAIEALGIEDPVGKILPGGIEIVGVARDFHYHTLHQPIRPNCFMLEPDHAMNMFVKLSEGTERKVIESIESLYKSFNPGFEFDYHYMDLVIRAQYAAERRVASLSKWFAMLAIVISCLGLFGLAFFTAERRTKEIGIRKVLGSDVIGIVYLLTKDFSKTILISVVIALPLGYYLMNSWLDGFAYRVSVEWWYFIGAGTVALMIAWFTVGTIAIKAANANPTKCLRDE